VWLTVTTSGAACSDDRPVLSFYETGACECATCFAQPFCTLADGTFVAGECPADGTAARPISRLLEGTTRSEVFYCDQLPGLDVPDAEVAATLASCGDDVTGHVDLCIDVPSCALEPDECGPGTGPEAGELLCPGPNTRESSKFACTDAVGVTESEGRARTREMLVRFCSIWGEDVPPDAPGRYCFLLCSKKFEATPSWCPYAE